MVEFTSEGAVPTAPSDMQADAPSDAGQVVATAVVDGPPPTAADKADTEPPDGAPANASSPETVGELDAVVSELARLTAQLARLNERAAHRETVIDNLHGELERLRTGERRGVLRPALTSIARLRDDLLRQADTLPADFDAARASRLLRSFADSIEIVLDNNGVVIDAPAVGDPFDARRHRSRRTVPTQDVSAVGRIAEVRRPIYRDLETDNLLSPAEVVVYVVAPTESDAAPNDER